MATPKIVSYNSYIDPKFSHLYTQSNIKDLSFLVPGFQFLMTLPFIGLWKLVRHKVRGRKLIGGRGWNSKVVGRAVLLEVKNISAFVYMFKPCSPVVLE